MFRAVLVAGLSAGLLMSMSPPAQAKTSDLDELAKLNPQATSATLDRAVQAAVKSTGMSRTAVIAQAVQEAQASTAIVEAPGTGKLSRSISASLVSVGSGTVKQHVGVTQAKRDAAGAYAYGSLRGKAYNSNFAFNRDAYGSTMNCSQLVWAAYTIKAAVDLDSNGGFGVYPYNIKDSNLTTTYATL